MSIVRARPTRSSRRHERVRGWEALTTAERVSTACPECGESMKLRQGRHGPFLGCAAYPRCKGTLSVWSAGKSSPPKKPDPAPKQGRLAVVEINVPPCILCHEPMTKGQMGYVVAGTGWYHTKHQQ